ncbi:hypothetical protein [Aporhodopirellula aestuarii]|uniref:DUF2330 domain-containing protein n=1 Tax=Aporhodopirellula aestuarii TaxID=2950107 RepID=A0ABT0U3N8_9BACT|nr:hypothetical protein [Aporhodopirellula aestuarii]MCM2371521.1 hypothetical protein [Aporhodopirellula aestuarii]
MIVVLLFVAAFCSLIGTATAQDAPASMPAVDFVGIKGHYRAGQWTAVRFEMVPDAVLETTDGDGVPVFYEQDFLKDASKESTTASGKNTVFGYCIPGTEAAPLIIRSASKAPANQADGAAGGAALKTRFPEIGTPAEGPAMIPVEMPWIVVFGDPLGIEKIGANELLDRDASVAVTRVTAAESVPDHVLGLSGVDMIMITGSGGDVLEQLSTAQGAAIADWVRSGGELFVTLGGNAPRTLDASQWLVELLPPGVGSSSVTRMDPSGLETFANSQTRLSAFDGWQLPKTIGAGGVTLSSVGEALIAGRTSRRIGLPLAVRYTAGMGRITIVSADLDSAPFIQWPERLDLVTKLTGELLTQERAEVGSSFRLGGYSDLSGQVRRTLDRFSTKRNVSFSIIALIIATLIALVAPLDYLFVRRYLGNPLLGWATFPVVAVVLSVALVIAANPRSLSSTTAKSEAGASTSNPTGKDSLLRANAIELLDIDSNTQSGRLFRWSYLYSHPAQTVNVQASPSPALRAISRDVEYQVLSPFGAPGRSMGGIQIDGWSDPLRVPVSRLTSNSQDASDTGGVPLTSRIEFLELAPRSSKSIAARMQFQSAVDALPLNRRRNSDSLQGSLVNPLDVDLLDAMLIYQNIVYLLPTRFPAEATVKEVDQLRQKNFRWQLSRQRALESSSQTEAWDVTRSDQPERLAEMLMFHEVVGGVDYTGLQNEILGDLDLTDLLTKEQCILVGRCAEPWLTMDVSVTRRENSARTEGAASTDSFITPQGESQSWVRVILPVKEVRR